MNRNVIKTRYKDVVLNHIDDGYTLAKWMVGNASDASEILQDAAATARDALSAAPSESARAWFLAIVRRSSLNWIAGNRPKNLSTSQTGEDPGSSNAGRSFDDETEADSLRSIRGASGESVRRAIGELPLPLREAIVMRDVLGLDYKEIAEATAATVGQVTKLIARARDAIAYKLEEAS